MLPPAPRNLDQLARSDVVAFQDRRILALRRGIEAIGEALPEQAARCLVVIDRDAPAAVISHHAQIIDAVGMIGVIVRVEHAVEPPDTYVEQLLAEVGRGVHEHIGGALPALALNKDGAPPPPILRI